MVRRIFAEFTAGRGFYSIAEGLTRDDLVRAHGEGVDGPAGAAAGGRADLREFDGDDPLCPATGTDTAPGRAPECLPGTDSLRVQAAQEFAVELAAGRMPSVRAIRAQLHVGQPRAQRVRAYPAAISEVRSPA